MKRLHNMLLAFVCSLSLLICFTSPISAIENTQSKIVALGEQVASPRWWSGNPNPIHGSEAWLQNHMYLPAPSATAKRCAISALTGTAVDGGLYADVEKWILKGVLTGVSFGASFGIGYMVSYTQCLFG